MSVYKEEKTNTWRVIYRYTDWTGQRKQSQKRGFKTKREAQAWEREQMNKPIAYYAFEVLYWCGIREGELLALTPADFDFTSSAVVSIIFPFLLASSGCLYLLGHVCPRQFLAGSMGLCGFLLVGLSLAHRHFHFFTVPSLSPGWVGLCALLIAFCCHQFHHLLYHCAYAEMQVI